MLAYAPQRRTVGAGQNSRKTMMLVVAGHLAVVAIALMTKMTIDTVIKDKPIVVGSFKEKIPPPPPPPEPVPEPQPASQVVSHIDRQKPIVPVDIPLDRPVTDPGDAGPVDVATGTAPQPLPPIPLPPVHTPVRAGPVLRTAEANLRPPYPVDKIRTEEEATLRLRLTIDDHGRVVAVDPVGQADQSFLQAARRHLIRNWKYKPATVDGVATPTTIVISLSFRLEDA